MSKSLLNFVIEKIVSKYKPISFIPHVIVGDDLKLYESRFILPNNKVYRATGIMTSTSIYANPYYVFKNNIDCTELEEIANIEFIGNLNTHRKIPFLNNNDLYRLRHSLSEMSKNIIVKSIPEYSEYILEVCINFNPTLSISIIIGNNLKTFGSIVINNCGAYICFGNNEILNEIVGVINKCIVNMNLLC